MLSVHSSNNRCRPTLIRRESVIIPLWCKKIRPGHCTQQGKRSTQENKTNRIDPLYAVPATTSADRSPSTGKGSRAQKKNTLNMSSSRGKCPFDHAKPHGTDDSPSTALTLRKPLAIAVFGRRAKTPDQSVGRDGKDLNMVATARTPRTLFPIHLVSLLR
jgi:hypothetical protein